MEITRKKVSERIREVMLKLSLNQKQLAEKLDITQPAVSMYLNSRIPPAYILLRLSHLSGRSIEWFLTGDVSSMIYKVSEQEITYDQRLRLENKLSLLPAEIYKRVESLVDSILNTLES